MIIKYGMVGADHKGGVALAAFSFLLRMRVKEGRKEGRNDRRKHEGKRNK